MMKAAHTSETSVDIQLRTLQYIPEDSDHYTRRRENLKSHTIRMKFELTPNSRPSSYCCKWRPLHEQTLTIGSQCEAHVHTSAAGCTLMWRVRPACSIRWGNHRLRLPFFLFISLVLLHNNLLFHYYNHIIIIIIIISCHRFSFFPGTSPLEPVVNPTTQASSLSL
jgi:hypothetical protein